jgi:hypothetical protein
MSFIHRKLSIKAGWRHGLILAVVASGLAISAPAGAAVLASAGAPAASPSASASAAVPAVEVCGEGPALVRPASMILACADAGEMAVSLHWASWSASQAIATGTVTWRNCSRLCAESTRTSSASADFTLADPVREAATGLLFTRLEMQVTGPAPAGFLREVAFDEAPLTAAAAPLAGPSTVRTGSVVPAAASGTLGYAQIEGYWLDAGGPDGSAGSFTDAQVAAAITGAESSFLPGIIQPGVDYCGPGSDRAGWGLWQITCGNEVPQFGTNFQLLDPWNNAEAAVYLCLQDARAGFNCFTPWTTYLTGAYTGFLQATAPDLSISDPGEYNQVNGTPPGTPSSPPPAPGATFGPPMPGQGRASARVGGPVLDDPGSGNLEVYAVGTGGELFQRTWSPAHGWSAWFDLGGSVAGTPSAIYDPVTGNLEVYVRGAGGPLYEKDWNDKNGWSGWIDLGGTITGNPAVAYDPLSGFLEVYAVGSNGAVFERYYGTKNGWSGWVNLGGSVTASPSASYDPVSGNFEVYVRGAGGPLYEKDWNPNGGWSGWVDLGGTITGNPSATYDSLGGSMEVYAVGSNGGVFERYYAKSGWSGWINLGGSVTASPSASYDPVSGNFEVYVRGAGGPLYEKDWNPKGGWSGWIDLGGAITGTPDAIDDPLSGDFEVYATGTTGSVYERAFTPGKTWLGWANLGGAVSSV